jgi:hypothetical protein
LAADIEKELLFQFIARFAFLSLLERVRSSSRSILEFEFYLFQNKTEEECRVDIQFGDSIITK